MYKYFLLDRLRNKSAIFWCLVFPLLLMTCFKVAFGNLTLADDIDTKNVAIVKAGSNENYYEGFEAMIESLTEKGTNGDDALFLLKNYTDEEGVNEGLREGELDLAFKVYDDRIETLLPKEYTDTACGVGKAVADSYMTNSVLITTAFEENPLKAQEVIENLGESLDFVSARESSFVDESPNGFIWYFYSTFIMGILFNVNNGVELACNIKADAEPHAIRISVGPQQKSKLILSSYAACLTIQLAINAIQLFIMNRFYDIPLGKSPLKLVAFVVVCELFSLALGIILGCVLKGSIDSKTNKATAIIMASSFLSGEMVCQLTGIIEEFCPIINDINPATIMNMAFYRLAYSPMESDFYANLLKLIVFSVICISISVILLRREKYASL